VGGIVAVGAGVALAAAGGKSSSTPPAPAASPSPTGTTTSTFTGTIGPDAFGCNNQDLPTFTPSRAGALTATLTWTDPGQVIYMTLTEVDNDTIVATSTQNSNTSETLSFQVKNTTYGFGTCRTQGTGVVSFTIMATYPQ
jgi:hypothetical protein